MNLNNKSSNTKFFHNFIFYKWIKVMSIIVGPHIKIKNNVINFN